MKKEFKYAHLGAVQIWIRHLGRRELGCKVLAVLIDKRQLYFEQFLLGAIEASLNNNVVNFNVIPDYKVDISDVLNSLVLRIQTKGFNMIQNSKNLAIDHAIYYKLTNTVNVQSRLKVRGGTTTLFKTTRRNHTFIPEPIHWNNL